MASLVVSVNVPPELAVLESVKVPVVGVKSLSPGNPLVEATLSVGPPVPADVNVPGVMNPIVYVTSVTVLLIAALSPPAFVTVGNPVVVGEVTYTLNVGLVPTTVTVPTVGNCAIAAWTVAAFAPKAIAFVVAPS